MSPILKLKGLGFNNVKSPVTLLSCFKDGNGGQKSQWSG